jgi:hypothetical protein
MGFVEFRRLTGLARKIIDAELAKGEESGLPAPALTIRNGKRQERTRRYWQRAVVEQWLRGRTP